MNYEDFVRTLLIRMGLPCSKVDAGAVRDGVDRLVRLSAMVDDLLAEAGYDTMFDTREKCLEALRQDIKAKLGTAPVDREVLRLSTELADAWQKNWLLRDTIETQKKMRLDLAAEQDKLVAGLDEAQNQLAAERKKWPELKAEVDHLRATNKRLGATERAQRLTISLFERIILGHADPGAVMRDAETGETAHIAPDVRAALSRMSGLAAENRRLETELDAARRASAVASLGAKQINRDRIRLALLDFDPKVNTVGFINDLADHLVKRLA